MRAVAFDRGPDRRLRMHRQVIEHHHIAWSQRGHQDLFDIGQETRRVDGAIEHGGRASPSSRSAAMTVCVCQWLHGV